MINNLRGRWSTWTTTCRRVGCLVGLESNQWVGSEGGWKSTWTTTCRWAWRWVRARACRRGGREPGGGGGQLGRRIWQHASAPDQAALSPAPPQELVKLVNSRLPAGVEPLRVGTLPHWQLSKEDLKGRCVRQAGRQQRRVLGGGAGRAGAGVGGRVTSSRQVAAREALPRCAGGMPRHTLSRPPRPTLP